MPVRVRSADGLEALLIAEAARPLRRAATVQSGSTKFARGEPETLTDLRDRIAAAPVSWGICEVPGWGYQLPAGQVLDGMARIGMTASELGPDDFLPGSAVHKRERFNAAGLQCVGAFCPVKLHEPGVDITPRRERHLDQVRSPRGHGHGGGRRHGPSGVRPT